MICEPINTAEIQTVKRKKCFGCKEVKPVSCFPIRCLTDRPSVWFCNDCSEKRSNRPLNHGQAVKQATPDWLTPAHLDAIKSLYDDAWWITKLTGVEHQVDHIIPVRGKGFSGLHVPWNLQILSKSDNSGKCNRPPKNEVDLFWGVALSCHSATEHVKIGEA